MNEENQNSIFSMFPKHLSPLGNWEQKVNKTSLISIQYKNYEIKDDFCYINFSLHSHKEISNFAHIFLKTRTKFGDEVVHTQRISYSSKTFQLKIKSSIFERYFGKLISKEIEFYLEAVIGNEEVKSQTFRMSITSQSSREAITTYLVKWDGSIKKYIPPIEDEQFKNKIKYLYQDKSDRVHFVRILPLIKVAKRGNGEIIRGMRKGQMFDDKEKVKFIKDDKNFNGAENSKNLRIPYPKDQNGGGAADTAYIFGNEGPEKGNIYADGWHKKVYTVIRYKKIEGQHVELVQMDDHVKFLPFDKAGYSFVNTMRRYCNSGAYAGFIGALAEIGRNDIKCTGMCFQDATSFPSVSHPNGDSVDTKYFETKDKLKIDTAEEQRKMDAFKKFHFNLVRIGDDPKFKDLKGGKADSLHNDHLHAEDFDTDKISTVNGYFEE